MRGAGLADLGDTPPGESSSSPQSRLLTLSRFLGLKRGTKRAPLSHMAGHSQEETRRPPGPRPALCLLQALLCS